MTSQRVPMRKTGKRWLCCFLGGQVEDGILSIELPKLAPEPEKKMDRVIDIA